MGTWRASDGVDDGPELTSHGSDIAWRSEADAVLAALKKTWDVPLSKGGRVLALTVPECDGYNTRVDATRSELNKDIKAYKHDKL